MGIAICLGSVALPSMSSVAFAGDGNDLKATAEIRLCANYDVVIGYAELEERKSDQGVKLVNVTTKVEGLTPGSQGVHIHETENCLPCGAALGHFDPGPVSFTSPDGNHPFNLGDLVNIKAKHDGKGELKSETTRITRSDGPLSLFDMDGSAFIIYDFEDTFCPEIEDGIVVKGCASGSRSACGIIKRDR